MDRLPIEIISHIFLIGCNVAGFSAFARCRVHSWDPYPRGRTQTFDPSWDRFRLTITSVSKPWRAIAYSTPELWSIIAVEIMGLNSDTPFDFIKACLNRSKNRPLDIFLEGFNTKQIMAIWKIVALTLPRCRSLHLTIPSQTFQLVIPLPKNLNLLEEMNFSPNTPGQVNSSQPIFPTPSHVPRLRQLRLGSTAGTMIPHAPMESLHDFCIDGYDIILQPSILTRLSQARRLVLACYFIDDMGFKPVELAGLEELEFDDSNIVDLIRAPRLIRLTTATLRFMLTMKPDTFPLVRELMIRFSPEEVWPGEWEGPEPKDMPQHQLMPSVEIIRLPSRDIDIWQTVLSMLLGSENTSIKTTDRSHHSFWYFPSLRTLYCNESGGCPTIVRENSTPGDPDVNIIHERIDNILVRLLQQRPLLTVVVTDVVITPARIHVLPLELQQRIVNIQGALGSRPF
ncbi:hypothetical protein DL93DRAFT_2158975 [Clavulina sp. PMI_390]|nr:hypothetical protein DL93DRAFT_2158975 [Clavulina sp. PMI_390]